MYDSQNILALLYGNIFFRAKNFHEWETIQIFNSSTENFLFFPSAIKIGKSQNLLELSYKNLYINSELNSVCKLEQQVAINFWQNNGPTPECKPKCWIKIKSIRLHFSKTSLFPGIHDFEELETDPIFWPWISSKLLNLEKCWLNLETKSFYCHEKYVQVDKITSPFVCDSTEVNFVNLKSIFVTQKPWPKLELSQEIATFWGTEKFTKQIWKDVNEQIEDQSNDFLEFLGILFGIWFFCKLIFDGTFIMFNIIWGILEILLLRTLLSFMTDEPEIKGG